MPELFGNEKRLENRVEKTPENVCLRLTNAGGLLNLRSSPADIC